MDKQSIINLYLSDSTIKEPKKLGKAFAPTNIALCKYWGKRDKLLNLPVTSSLSISLDDKGATTAISILNGNEDKVHLNGQLLSKETVFYQRVSSFLALFREKTGHYYEVKTNTNIPVAAGLASSACGFAALVLAINDLYQWQLSQKTLSILARFGSGSASRSIIPGFVEWEAGKDPKGHDSFAFSLDTKWESLRIGLMVFETAQKPISSTMAMNACVETSPFYSVWPQQVARDIQLIRQAIHDKDFALLGQTAESNALAMHALMMSTSPTVIYATGETLKAMQQVWKAREENIPVYFTQDAGPNLKLLFLQKDTETILERFPSVEIVMPFKAVNNCQSKEDQIHAC